MMKIEVEYCVTLESRRRFVRDESLQSFPFLLTFDSQVADDTIRNEKKTHFL